MRIEIHLLQNFAPSNLNRDDTGSPKDADFGGHRRARISSQCIKRAVRRYFQERDLIPAAHLAVRTKRLLEYAHERLKKDGRDEASIRRAITTALAAGGLKLDEKKKNETQYLLFLGEGEIARFVALVDRHFDALAKEPKAAPAVPDKKKTAKKDKAEAKSAAPEEVQKAVPALFDGGKAADLARFGRMLADLPEKNVDAACQVAHAISTNKIHSMKMDYFTAVDDLKELARKQGLSEDAGAGMIETTAFNSACFYRYATLDVAELVGGFRDDKKTHPFGLQGDVELAKTTASAFLQAFVHAIPTGKQNSFAAHNPPSLVFAVVRDGPPVSLANAFVKPVTPRDGKSLVEESIKAMDDYYGRLIGMYGEGGRKASAVCQMDGVQLTHLKEAVESVEDLIVKVTKAAFPAGGAA
jgi:CRISPR system Cascade subunit CasC